MINAPRDGTGVRLRAFTDADIDDLVLGYADPLVRRFIPTLPAPYTSAAARRWISTEAPALFAAGGAGYAIADPATDRLLGGVELDRLVPGRRQAEIGYWVAPWARGRGVARAAVRVLSDAAFGEGVERLELLTDWTNPASQRVALAAGFAREGVRRGGAIGLDGTGRRDLLVFARLADDPPGPVPRLLPDQPAGGLTDGTVTVRPLGPADAAFHAELAVLPENIASRVPAVAPTADELERRCTRAAAYWLAGERADLVVVDAASGVPAGEIGLFFQEPQTAQALLGYQLAPAWRGRGYATRAVILVARWALTHSPIARLVAGTLPSNVASQRVLIRAGFRREGLLRSRLPGASGQRTDDVQFALIAEDLAD